MRFNETSEVATDLLTASEDFYNDIYFDVYEPNCLKFGMVIATIEFYILILS